jgi:ligand-binding sensor domain-containing protein
MMGMDSSCRKLAALVVASMLALLSGVRAEAALPENLIVERLGEERGFPSGTITALYRDRAGFLWVGSREGLAFWDGYSIRSFEQIETRPHCRTIRFASFTKTAPAGSGSGRTRAARAPRPGHRSIRRAAARPGRSDEPEPRQRLRDAECPDGSLWVGTQEGLNRLDPKTRKFERLRGLASASTIPHDYVTR